MTESMKIYICSPYRGYIERNKRYASQCAIEVTAQGHIPVVPHLLFTDCLNDDDIDERKTGIAMAETLLLRCDEVWVYAAYGISEGMADEMLLAWSHNIPLEFKATPGIKEKEVEHHGE